MLFCGGQDALKSNDQEVIDDVGVDIFGSTPHELMLKPRNTLANRRFHFTLCLRVANLIFPRFWISAVAEIVLWISPDSNEFAAIASRIAQCGPSGGSGGNVFEARHGISATAGV